MRGDGDEKRVCRKANANLKLISSSTITTQMRSVTHAHSASQNTRSYTGQEAVSLMDTEVASQNSRPP